MAHHPAGSPAPTQPGSLSRRTVLRGSLLGAGAVTAPALLAACSSKKSGSSGSSNKPTTFGSNHSDPTDKQAMTAAINAYTTKTGKQVTINTVDHGTFQENINRYLQGTPEDAFSWFAGYRMQFFAAKGLATDISDVWKDSAFSDFSPALKAASTGQDGKQYFVPFYYYQWAVFYRKSLWQQHGYTAPKTWDEYKALAAKMKSDGLVPISLGDKDGWPAMGTFDYINMRQNGYQFHVDLMAGKEDWTSDKVKKVFDTWAGILPVPGDRRGQRAGLGGGTHRRVHALQEGQEPRGRQGTDEVPRYAGSGIGLPQGVPVQPRLQQQVRHGGLQHAAEEGRRPDQQRQAHLAVHGPRHPARLRLYRHDPFDPAVPCQPQGHR